MTPPSKIYGKNAATSPNPYGNNPAKITTANRHSTQCLSTPPMRSRLIICVAMLALAGCRKLRPYEEMGKPWGFESFNQSHPEQMVCMLIVAGLRADDRSLENLTTHRLRTYVASSGYEAVEQLPGSAFGQFCLDFFRPWVNGMVYEDVKGEVKWVKKDEDCIWVGMEPHPSHYLVLIKTESGWKWDNIIWH